MSCGLRSVLFVACCPLRDKTAQQLGEGVAAAAAVPLPQPVTLCVCVPVCVTCIGHVFVYLLRINQIASCQFAGFNATRGLILAIVVCLAV